MIHVEKVKVPELPAMEASAIREAESEAMKFYAQFEEWDEECVRLTELYKVVSIIVKNRYSAELSVIAYLNENDTLFTYDEKENLINIARDSCKSETIEDSNRLINIMRWTRPVQNAYRAMRNETLDNVIGLPAKLIEQIK